MIRVRRLRPGFVAALTSLMLTLLTVATAFAGDGGSPYPH
jgi:hypothetical protein